MTDAVFDFKSINRKLNRQEQKAEFEEKNPKVEPSMYGWPYGVAVPFDPSEGDKPTPSILRGAALLEKLYGNQAPLKSLAHPEWPYAGTGFEWTKFVKVKI